MISPEPDHAGHLRARSAVDGYLFFDDITPETRSALLELVDDGLLRVAAVTVSGSAAAYAVYDADDVRTAYATIEAVVSSVGRPSRRILAVSQPGTPPGRQHPGTRPVPDGSTVVLALLPVPLGRASEVANVLTGMAPGAGVATVIGSAGTVLLEVDGTDPVQLQAQVSSMLTAAGVDIADILITTTALGRGWAS